MKVWVVEPVGYNQYGICGLYATLEAAKASKDWVPGWKHEKDGSWTSTDADCCAETGYSIFEETVQGA